MSRYAQRLSRVAKIFGCPVHSEALVCRSCHPPEPMPETLKAGMHTLVTSIVDRLGREVLTAAMHRVARPPSQETCSRCGVRQTCIRCEGHYGLKLLRNIGLNSGEQGSLDAMLAECRHLDRERRGYDE